MKLTNLKVIGTDFKKENIVLATVLIGGGTIRKEEVDLFYKDDNGYTCFDEIPTTIVGDNSDGKGVICNEVSVWKYYSEDQLRECIVHGTNGPFKGIVTTTMEPLEQYNREYNL